MFGIDRKDGGAEGARGPHHQGTGRHQGLFVGQGDGLSGPDGGEGGTQAAESDHGGDDGVHPFSRDQPAGGIDPGMDFHRSTGKAFLYFGIL